MKSEHQPLVGSGQWDLLAGLRFLLASIVACGHLGEFVPATTVKIVAAFGAFEAIMGFLVISGYSIGSSLRQRPHGFFWRRMARVYPVYLASVLITLLIAGGWKWSHLADLFFLNQIVTDNSYVGPAWTLALEVWLYALAPLLVRLAYRPLAAICLASFAGYAVYTAGRTLFHWNYFSGTTGGINLPLLAFMWVAGFALSGPAENRARACRLIGGLSLAHLLLSAAVGAGYSWKHHEMAEFVRVFLPDWLAKFATLALVFQIFRRGLAEWSVPAWARRPLRLAGDISYPLYLVHYPIYMLCQRWGVQAWPIMLLAALAAAFLVFILVDFYSQKRDAMLKGQASPLPA